MEKKDVDNAHKSNTIVYTIRWNPLKSLRLKRLRGVSFEEILEGELLDIRENPGRNDQHILIFDYRSCIWAVPVLLKERKYF